MSEVLDWIIAIGTLVAIGTTLFLVSQGQRDRTDAAPERRSTQAAQVTCWTEWNDDWDGATFAQPRCPSIHLRNASEAAVFEAFVDFYSPTDLKAHRVDLGAIAPETTVKWDIEDDFDTSGWVPEALLPKLYFRDANGSLWTRNARGILKPDLGPGNDDPVVHLPRRT